LRRFRKTVTVGAEVTSGRRAAGCRRYTVRDNLLSQTMASAVNWGQQLSGSIV